MHLNVVAAVAAVILLVVRRIEAVVARDTSTTTTSMSNVMQLTVTTAPHRDVNATAPKITADTRNTRTTTMVARKNMTERLTGMAAMANIVAVMKYKGVLT